MRKLFIVALWAVSLAAYGQTCPQGTAYPDGCSGATTDTPQFPHALDLQKVVLLNIISGSGYTNGTYTWTTTGGGGTGATGTVTVSGGALGGAFGILYTISNEGSGYTSRPTIAVPAGAGAGTGGSISAMVHQKRPPWNVPGVDYYVGLPSSAVLLDPTNPTNLPSGAAFAGTTVTVTGCNVTLADLDFTLHNTNININVTTTACLTTLNQIKMLGNANAVQNITIASTNKGAVLIEYSDLNGNAPLGQAGSGLALDGEIIDFSQAGSNITLKYNYCHEFDSKCIQISGSTLSTRVLTEQFNAFYAIDTCPSGCSHGENEYSYTPPSGSLAVSIHYNFYLTPFLPQSSATSQSAVQADNTTINGTGYDHNTVFAPGPGTTCTNSNSNAYQAAANVFDGQQNDPGAALLENVVFSYNYLDGSGDYFNWYHAGGSSLIYANNIDAGAGGLCNQLSKSPPTAPTASPAGGSYSGTQTVSLSNPSGAPVICWNTATSPVTNQATGCSNGTVYTGPITVSSSETLYYVAGGTSYDDSIQASSTYTIGNSFTCSPSTLPTNHSGHIALTCTATGGLTWNGSTAFNTSGTCTYVSTSNTSSTSQTVTVTTGGSTGTCTIADTTDSVTSPVTVATATLSISPNSGNTSTTPSLTLTGANTLWNSETASSLFSLSGGGCSGESLTTPTIVSNTSATATLTTGSAACTITVTDNSTGATTTFTVTSSSAPIVAPAPAMFSKAEFPFGSDSRTW